MSEINKVILAYSGGLDTSVILKWLAETYACDVVAFSADIGQEEELDTVEEKAMKTAGLGKFGFSDGFAHTTIKFFAAWRIGDGAVQAQLNHL